MEHRRVRIANALAEENNYCSKRHRFARMELSEILYNKAEYIETVCAYFMFFKNMLNVVQTTYIAAYLLLS